MGIPMFVWCILVMEKLFIFEKNFLHVFSEADKLLKVVS